MDQKLFLARYCLSFRISLDSSQPQASRAAILSLIHISERCLSRQAGIVRCCLNKKGTAPGEEPGAVSFYWVYLQGESEEDVYKRQVLTGGRYGLGSKDTPPSSVGGRVPTRLISPRRTSTVSYTHLDVYKRQTPAGPSSSGPALGNTAQFPPDGLSTAPAAARCV